MSDLWAGAEVYVLTLLRRLQVRPDFSVSAILFNEGRLADELRRLGISVTIISECTDSSTTILGKLVRHFRDNPCDVMHTHKPKDNVLGALAGIISGRCRIVRTLHGAPEPFQGLKSLKMGFYELLDRVVIKLMISRVIVVSLDLRKLIQKGWTFRRIECIHNGIELSSLRIGMERGLKRRELGVGEDEILIGTVGRLTVVKGQESLIRAAAVLLSVGCKIKVVLVGSGPLLEPLRELVDNLGIRNDVFFVGHQANVTDFLEAMDIFVLPSLHEGIPLALLEALALERPVVATRVGGVPEVIDHGVSGLLVTPGDTQLLWRSIRELIDDRPKARNFGKAGRARIEQEFNADLMARRTLQLYQSLLSGHTHTNSIMPW